MITEYTSNILISEAAHALANDAGCPEDRARCLVDAIARVSTKEALDLIVGNRVVASGVVDTRVARLKELVGALEDKDPFPNPYELGVIFRITPSQARSVIGAYQARHSGDYRTHMDAQIKGLIGRRRAGAEGLRIWEISFEDPAALDYAYDKLRRRGLVKTLVRDPTALTLTVSRDVKDCQDRDAKEILEFVEA